MPTIGRGGSKGAHGLLAGRISNAKVRAQKSAGAYEAYRTRRQRRRKRERAVRKPYETVGFRDSVVLPSFMRPGVTARRAQNFLVRERTIADEVAFLNNQLAGGEPTLPLGLTGAVQGSGLLSGVASQSAAYINGALKRGVDNKGETLGVGADRIKTERETQSLQDRATLAAGGMETPVRPRTISFETPRQTSGTHLYEERVPLESPLTAASRKKNIPLLERLGRSGRIATPVEDPVTNRINIRYTRPGAMTTRSMDDLEFPATLTVRGREISAAWIDDTGKTQVATFVMPQDLTGIFGPSGERVSAGGPAPGTPFSPSPKTLIGEMTKTPAGAVPPGSDAPLPVVPSVPVGKGDADVAPVDVAPAIADRINATPGMRVTAEQEGTMTVRDSTGRALSILLGRAAIAILPSYLDVSRRAFAIDAYRRIERLDRGTEIIRPPGMLDDAFVRKVEGIVRSTIAAASRIVPQGEDGFFIMGPSGETVHAAVSTRHVRHAYDEPYYGRLERSHGLEFGSIANTHEYAEIMRRRRQEALGYPHTTAGAVSQAFATGQAFTNARRDPRHTRQDDRLGAVGSSRASAVANAYSAAFS